MLSEKLVVPEAHCSHIKQKKALWNKFGHAKPQMRPSPNAILFPAPSPSHPFSLLISEFQNTRSSLILAAPLRTCVYVFDGTVNPRLSAPTLKGNLSWRHEKMILYWLNFNHFFVRKFRL